MTDRPEIVCLCGSTRFAEEFRAVNLDLTLAGVIVLAPGELAHASDRITDEQKARLDALHLAKIDLADRVVVVNPGGYIGKSTRREIDYAHKTGTPVEYTDPRGHPSPEGSRPEFAASGGADAFRRSASAIRSSCFALW